jgi:hypothetical protein
MVKVLLQLAKLVTGHQMLRKPGIRLLHGIEAFEFDARIRRAKLPVDRADLLIPMGLPAPNPVSRSPGWWHMVGQLTSSYQM